MKKSLRSLRRARHHARLKSQSKLNLVSLMDIFTILVFFLLLNSSDVEVLQSDKTITLPKSVAQGKPGENLLILVNETEVSLGGKRLVAVADILSRPEGAIQELAEELKAQASAQPSEPDQEAGYPITIMGDQALPYALLKRVLLTCADSDFRDISLAVNQIASVSAAPSISSPEEVAPL